MENSELNGWRICFHDCFVKQISSLAQYVAELQKFKPDEYQRKKETKLLAAIEKVIKDKISVNPLDTQFRQGDTLGHNNKHWFRAKFMQQFRLFFRCSEEHKTIIICWVNDFDTLRAYGSKNDAYKVFASMLKAGNPPDDWEELVSQTKSAGSIPGFLQNQE